MAILVTRVGNTFSFTPAADELRDFTSAAGTAVLALAALQNHIQNFFDTQRHKRREAVKETLARGPGGFTP